MAGLLVNCTGERVRTYGSTPAPAHTDVSACIYGRMRAHIGTCAYEYGCTCMHTGLRAYAVIPWPVHTISYSSSIDWFSPISVGCSYGGNDGGRFNRSKMLEKPEVHQLETETATSWRKLRHEGKGRYELLYNRVCPSKCRYFSWLGTPSFHPSLSPFILLPVHRSVGYAICQKSRKLDVFQRIGNLRGA